MHHGFFGLKPLKASNVMYEQHVEINISMTCEDVCVYFSIARLEALNLYHPRAAASPLKQNSSTFLIITPYQARKLEVIPGP